MTNVGQEGLPQDGEMT